MNKENILKAIQKETDNDKINFPRDIEFASNEGALTVTMSAKGLIDNMQEDDAAFEGWAIAIKANLPEQAKKVCICWHGNDVAAKTPIKDKAHYNRFLYRVIHFTRSYDWACYKCLDEKATNDINQIINELDNKKWVANFPKSTAKKTTKGEAGLEYVLNEVLNLNPDIKANNHQLPVGLFYEKIKTNKHSGDDYERTPRGKSQIDLWSINNANEFYVYELKLDANYKVGIISELMFYLNVFKDISEGIISYPKNAIKYKHRSFDKIYEAFASPKEKHITKIAGVFLANKLHPLLVAKSADLLKVLSANNRGITYKHMEYAATIYEV